MAADSSNFQEIKSVEQFQQLLSQDLDRISLIDFWADWAEPCKPMNQVVQELAKKHPKLLVLQVSAEDQVDIANSFDVEVVPTFLIIRGHTLLDRISGADTAKLTKSIETHVGTVPSVIPLSKTSQAPPPPPTTSAPAEETQQELETRLRKLMNQSKVVLFMKGSPSAPRCGFSRKAIALLNEQKVEFTHFDILTDESVRQGLKVLNNWPTFPQIIVNGELIGGLDVAEEMVGNGEFQEILAPA